MLRLPSTTKSRVQLTLIIVGLAVFTMGVKAVADYFDWIAKSVDLRDAIELGDLNIVKQFEREGFDWRNLGKFEDNYTALHQAAGHHQLALVRYFVENGADVTAEMDDGTTPAGIAASRSDLAIMKYLLMETPEGESIVRNDTSIFPIERFADLELVGWMAARIDLKGAIAPKGVYRYLYAAVNDGDTEMVEYFLTIGAPEGMATEVWDEGFYRTPQPNSANAVPWLALQDPLMPNPLHLAAQHGYENIAKLLLDYGARPTLQDFQGKIPIDYARENGHESVAKLLEDAVNQNVREAE